MQQIAFINMNNNTIHTGVCKLFTGNESMFYHMSSTHFSDVHSLTRKLMTTIFRMFKNWMINEMRTKYVVKTANTCKLSSQSHSNT